MYVCVKWPWKWIFLRLACTREETCAFVWWPSLYVTYLAATCDHLRVRVSRITIGKPPGYWKVSRTFLRHAFLWNKWLMHVTSISHHVPNPSLNSQLEEYFTWQRARECKLQKCRLWLFLPVSQAVKHFSSFLYYLITLKNKISDLNLPSLSCFGDCMSGNDDVLAVDDTDTRSPVTGKKNSSSTGTQNSRN